MGPLFLFTLLLLAPPGPHPLPGHAPPGGRAVPQRPNLLLVLADDLGADYVAGYGEARGTYGPTPVIDSLMQAGTTFRRAYAAPVCSPTRLGLLTGEYPLRYGVGSAVDYDSCAPDETPPVDGSYAHVPALIAAAGYRTAVIGKWHLANQCNGQMLHPLLVGFETHRGTVGNIGDYFAWEYWVDGVSQGVETTYATTKVVDDALAVIASFGDDPWFVQVAFQAPHKPIHQPPPELTGITLQADSPPSLGFRAVIEALDTELGRLLASLAPEVLRNTVVIVMSDNGTPGSLVQDQVFKPAKGSVHEHGSRVPLIIAGPRVPAGVQRFGLVQEVDVAMTVLDLAGAELPTRDGLSVLPYLLGRLPGSPRLAALADRREPNGTSGSFVLLQRSIRSERHRLVNDQLALTGGKTWALKTMIGVDEQLVHTPYEADEQAVFDALKAQLLAAYGD